MYGGRADPETFELEVLDVEDGEDQIIVHVRVTFAEAIPTSCADIDRRENMQGELEVTVDKKSGDAEIADGDLMD